MEKTKIPDHQSSSEIQSENRRNENEKSIPLTHIYTSTHFWLVKDTSIKHVIDLNYFYITIYKYVVIMICY